MKSCEEFEMLANLVIDEEATLEERSELTRHLKTCPDCRSYFEDIRRIHESFSLEPVVVPENFSAQVMARVRAAEQDQPQERTVPFPHWRRWTALAACCAAAVLGVWAAGSFGSVKDAMVTMNNAPQAAVDVRSMQEASSAQSVEGDVMEREASVLSDGAPPSLTAEAGDPAEFAKEASRDEYELPAASDAKAEFETAASPEDAAGGGSGQERMDAPAEADGASPAADEAEPAESAEEFGVPLPSPAQAPAGLEGSKGTEDSDEVAPAEVIGVPEPGILIAFGGAARGWVERTLGLEWADGGSYPLTAEQYGDLLRTLDLAGETYRVEPGEGYCLMTE